jgi:CBS domain containing-hemolysin-like protein
MTSLLITILLLLGNAFFVAGEFSLIASRRTMIEPLAETSASRSVSSPSARSPSPRSPTGWRGRSRPSTCRSS